MSVSGFWSYSRQADDADRGRVAELARLVADEYRNLTGTRLDLYLDVDSNQLGVDWRQKINESLRISKFLVSVVSPLYYWSPECQRELGYFLRKARDLGRSEVLIPIRYIGSGYPDHPMTPVLDRYHWEDWTALRLSEPNGEAHRRAVHAVASRLARLAAPPAAGAPVAEPTAVEPAVPEFTASEPSVPLAVLTEALETFTEASPRFAGRVRAGDIHTGVSGLLDSATAFADALWEMDDLAAAHAPAGREFSAVAGKARSALNTLMRPVADLRHRDGLPERTRLLCVLLQAALVDARTTIEAWTPGRH